MKIVHSLSSTVNAGSATIEVAECVTHSMGTATDEALVHHYNTVIDTKDKLVSEGLIALGWTPPAGNPVLHSKRERQPRKPTGSPKTTAA